MCPLSVRTSEPRALARAPVLEVRLARRGRAPVDLDARGGEPAGRRARGQAAVLAYSPAPGGRSSYVHTMMRAGAFPDPDYRSGGRFIPCRNSTDRKNEWRDIRPVVTRGRQLRVGDAGGQTEQRYQKHTTHRNSLIAQGNHAPCFPIPARWGAQSRARSIRSSRLSFLGEHGAGGDPELELKGGYRHQCSRVAPRPAGVACL